MNALDPNNNYGGGKVKFFTGGTGGGGQTIYLLPIIIGSNRVTTAQNGAIIPLNATYYINDGVDPNEIYIESSNAYSYVPTLGNQFYYYTANGVIQGLSPNDIDVRLKLYVDGIIIDETEITLNSDNNYTESFAFSPTSNLNDFPVTRYGIVVEQIFGTGTQFEVSCTNVFLTPYNLDGDSESEFFTSSNLNGLELVASDIKYFGFGGQTNANSMGAIPLVLSVVDSSIVTEIHQIYIIFSTAMNLGGSSVEITLDVDGTSIETFEVTGNVVAYEPIFFNLNSIAVVASNGNFNVFVQNNWSASVFLFEVGVCGYEL